MHIARFHKVVFTLNGSILLVGTSAMKMHLHKKDSPHGFRRTHHRLKFPSKNGFKNFVIKKHPQNSLNKVKNLLVSIIASQKSTGQFDA